MAFLFVGLFIITPILGALGVLGGAIASDVIRNPDDNILTKRVPKIEDEDEQPKPISKCRAIKINAL
jgi:hypothetical protein